MSKHLFLHINKYVEVSAAEFSEITSFLNTKIVEKKDTLMHAGSKNISNYFVINGCLHMYFIAANGTEKVVQFAINNWWISDYLAHARNKKTNYFIQASTQSEIVELSSERQKKLFKAHPKMEIYFRHIYQIALGASLSRIEFMFDYSKEERYLNFVKNYPEFVQQVPQYLLASYLGLTPEYVSEIRGKIRS